jgi:hypothetical protein
MEHHCWDCELMLDQPPVQLSPTVINRPRAYGNQIRTGWLVHLELAIEE